VLSYIARRLAWLVFILLGVSTLTFAISHIIPADPVRAAVGQQASQEEVLRLTHELGLDQPVHVQFGRYLARLLRGDLGYSLVTRRPVLQDLLEFFPATLELVLVSLAFMVLVSIPVGVVSAAGRGRFVDLVTRVPTIIATGVPIFWLGLLGQFAFYYYLQILPFGGQLATTTAGFPRTTGFLLVDSILAGNFALLRQVMVHLVMPVFVLSIGRVAVIARLTRASVLEVLNQDFIRTARSKGLATRVVLLKHALKPALLPILTEIGLQFGWLLSGTIIVESIFAWPGIGTYAFSAINSHDLPAIMGVTLLLTFFKVTTNLGVDVLYTFVDPRIRY
jgi:peptide/nickel transport system permease protein